METRKSQYERSSGSSMKPKPANQSTWLQIFGSITSGLCMTPLLDAICSLTWPPDLPCHDGYHQRLEPCVLNHLFLSVISALNHPPLLLFNLILNTFIFWQLILEMKDLNRFEWDFQGRLRSSADLRCWWYTPVTAPVCLIGLCSEAIICIWFCIRCNDLIMSVRIQIEHDVDEVVTS